MVKLLHQKNLQKLIILLLFLPAVSSWGQSFTIARGTGETANAVTGITISYNGAGSCTTSANGSDNIQMVLTAQPGYNFTITSIQGTGVRSSAGKDVFNFQLVNNGTVNGTTATIGATSSCSGGTTVPNIVVPAANQTVTSGSSATIKVIRNAVGTAGTGYAHMKSFKVIGVVSSATTAPTITGNASQIFTYGTAGSYNFTIAGTPAPTVSATLNPSGALPTGITLDTANSQIDVSNTTAAGTYDITISATNTSGTDTQDVTLTVNKANQTITFANITKAYGDPDFNLTATGGSSGEPVTYTSSDPTVATVTGTTVTIVGVGTTNITASQAGNTNYNAAADVIRTLTVNKANQTISNFSNITKIYGDADFNLTATGGGSGEPVTYISSDTNVATITGNTVTIIGAGTSTITASQAGNSNYNAGSLARTLTVNKAGQTITFANITKTYGDADFNLTANGGSSGEPVTYISSNTSVATISGTTVTITGTGTTNITASQAGNANYDAAIDVIRTLTVDPKTITITGITADNKVYDRNTTATLSGAVLTASEIVGSDDVSLSTYTAVFNNEFVGTNKPVAITYQLTGAQANRYTLTQPTGLTAAITTKELTISGIQINNKAYDGNTSATITGTPVLNGIISPDDVTIDSTVATAAFNDPNIGAAIPVIVTGYALAGADATNYSLQQPQGLTANITNVSLQNQTIAFNTLSDVTYGDASFNLSATATSGLTVTYTSSDTSVATVTGNTVTILNVGTTTITANQAGDGSYNPAPAVQQQLTVNPKTLTVTNAAITDKVYDQTTTAAASGTLSGVINSDDVTLVSAATFTTDNAGNNIAATSQYSITGNNIAKYILTQPVVTGNILPASLTLAAPAANNKAYDGNTSAVITGTLSGILSGDTVTFNGAGTFADANVANGITVTSTSTLAGADASNYVLTQPTGLSANITSLSLTVNATASDKVYDRSTDATIIVSQINGLVSGDDVTVSGNGTFNNFNVGTNKPVTANLTLSGTDAVNYTFTQPTGLTASISKKTLTVDTTNTTVTTKTYDNTTAAALPNTVLIGIVAGDETNVNALSGNFAQATPGIGILVNNIALSGTAALNYDLTQPTTLTGDILPKQLTLTAVVAQNKVYDGNDSAVITGTLNGKIVTDIVTLNGIGTFASSDVANGIVVTAAATLSGANASNYTLLQPTGLTANITPKSLSVTATALDKVYDKTTAAIVNNAQIVAAGIIAGDDVSLTSTAVSGTFNNATVGNNKNVTANFTLQGSDAANYTITTQTYQASITPLGLTADITSAAVTPKTYDATTSGAVITGAILNGVLGGDTVNIGGTFASANVGTGIAVTLSLTGTSAANYTLTQPSPGLSGEIIKKTLTATADNKTKTQGTANPALTISYTGFAGGQTAGNAAGFVAPVTTTTAITTSPTGAYPIALTGGSADNYAFNLVNGWMIVNPTGTAPSQILAWDFTGENTAATSTAEIADTKLDSSPALTRGAGASASAGANSFRTQGFQNNGIAVSNTDYFQFIVSADPTYQLSLNTITASFDGTTSFANSPGVSHQFAYSLDGTSFILIGSPTVTIGTTPTINIDLSGVTALQNVAANTNVTFRYYASGQTTTGGWGYKSSGSGVYGLSVNGSIITAPAAPQITSILATNSDIGDSELYQISASGTPVITLSATNLPAGATIDNAALITFDGTTPAGVYNINLKATSFYGTDNKVLVYTVNKLNQFLTFTPDPIPTKFLNDAPFAVSVTNTAPLALTYASSDTSVATVAQDGTVTIVGTGTTTISASNTGDSTYNAVNIGRTLTVLPTPQITATPTPIAFTAIQGQGPSAATQLSSITAINLVPASGNITLTASAGFETAMGIGAYGTTGSFTYTGGAVNQTNPQIFVRFAAGQTEGTYNGTLTITGGNATVQIPLTAVVELAPAIVTATTAFAPYCLGTATTISLPYTTQGTFTAGNFYVQHSDALGVFPNDFSNIISTPGAGSPITATLPSSLTAGNYRVRVIHLSSGLVLTSSTNDNGSDIIINNTTPAPTATALAFCNAATVANLTATGTDLKWYANANGGTQLNSADAVTTGNYFVSQTLNSCESARTQVAVTVNTTPAPTATALAFCNAATVANLTATGTDLKWYANANGGAQLTLADAVTTGNYFVSQTLNSCESARTQVAVTVNTTPAPTATALAFCNTATVANLTATGTDLKWYANANGGAQLTLADAVTTGNYFVSQTLNSCESARTQVAVTVNTTPAPTATALAFCNTATVANLTATGTNLKWYANANGGAQLTLADAVTTGNYFVSQTLNSCESTRTQVAVTVNTTPAPTATALAFCNAATIADLTATGTDLKWYANANGGAQLNSADAVTTGNYFVSQTLNSCESARTQVAVTVNTTPAPTATALVFCNTATVANLTAIGTDLKWYTNANGGAQLNSADAVTTGNYFVSQTLNNCESTRTQIAVTVNTTPAPTATALVFCNTATVANLTATGTDLKWYTNANGGTQLNSADAVTTGNYFVSQTLNSCESARTQVAVTVNTTPAPTATALAFCNTATVANLTATGTDLKWYANANGGAQLTLADAVTTGNYFVSQTLNSCESTRTQVAVTVNTTPAPTATALAFTGSATVADLTASGTNLKWYTASTGGAQLTNTTPITTGSYFVSQTINGCESTRTEVEVTVNTTPPAPVATDHVFCNSAFVNDLSAEGANLKWYETVTGGTQLPNSTALTTGSYYVTQTVNGIESDRTEIEVTVNVTPAPTASSLTFCQLAFASNLTATGTNLKWYTDIIGGTPMTGDTALASGSYYVSQTLNDCESARTEVAVVINTTPAPQASALIFCPGATVADLTATGTDLKWYDASTGGTLQTPATVLVNGNYYVSQTLGGCESARTLVVVSLTATPLPVAANQTFCESVTIADLSATGDNLKWYVNLTGGTPLNELTPVTSGTYYVSQTLNGCESERKSVIVTANVTEAPQGETEQLFAEEGMTIANLEAEGENINWYSSEADAIAGTNPLSDDTLLASETTYYATQTVNGCESNNVLSVLVTIVLDINEVHQLTFNYYPNPVVDKLQITSQSTITNVTVYTLTGQTVINEKWNTQDGKLDMSSLESGIYIVKINFGNIEKVIRIIRDK